MQDSPRERVPVKPVTRTIVGTRDELASMLADFSDRGALVAYGRPRNVVGDGRVALDVDLLLPAAPPRTQAQRYTPRATDVGTSTYATHVHPHKDVPTPRIQPHTDVRTSAHTSVSTGMRVRRTVVITAVVTLLISFVVIGAVWAVALIVAWVAAHLLQIVGGIVAVLVLLGLAAGAGGGSGHCPGPWHR